MDKRKGPAAVIAGFALGGLLLGWAVLALYAPGLGAMVALFGSPVVVCILIVRLLTLSR